MNQTWRWELEKNGATLKGKESRRKVMACARVWPHFQGRILDALVAEHQATCDCGCRVRGRRLGGHFMVLLSVSGLWSALRGRLGEGQGWVQF